MAKKVFVFLTFVVIVALVAMALTKPESWKHQAAVRELAMTVVGQKMADVQLPQELVSAGTEMAMGAAGDFLQSNMEVSDYFFLSVGFVNFRGQSVPVTVGAFGNVYVLVDEEDVKRIIS
jgi:hypothetical protein